MIYYVCKYTPLELFAGFGEECRILEEVPDNFDLSDRAAHANLCGFGKSVIQAVLEENIENLVLVNCCDVMRRTYDILKSAGRCRFLYLLDLPHDDRTCEKERFAESLLDLKNSFEDYSGETFDRQAFLDSFRKNPLPDKPYIGILGARVNRELEEFIQGKINFETINLTCVRGRNLENAGAVLGKEALQESEEDLFLSYADILLSQMPCFRMNRTGARTRLFLDPKLRGIVYHTIKFCDYYGFEYASMDKDLAVPLLKIETDFTRQSAGQLSTRLEAYAETLAAAENAEKEKNTDQPEREVSESGAQIRNRGKEGQQEMNQNHTFYAAGIDSGSATTDAVILDQDRKIVSSVILATGGGAAESAEKCLALATEKAGISPSDISGTVATGYGRAYIGKNGGTITEITCHAKGAHYLNPDVRTVIDIGGQDIKAIRIDENGAVKNFLMNDKCAAGTGRFLELMARTLGLSLEEMGQKGLDWKENIVISSMCTVFAESEVVSLVAQNKAVPDIIHGLNVSVASKVNALASRLGDGPAYMMTGGVANNPGVVRELEKKLGQPLYICEESQLCGALGAALFAAEKLET